MKVLCYRSGPIIMLFINLGLEKDDRKLGFCNYIMSLKFRMSRLQEPGLAESCSWMNIIYFVVN